MEKIKMAIPTISFSILKLRILYKKSLIKKRNSNIKIIRIVDALLIV
jgi:hypothetical protein